MEIFSKPSQRANLGHTGHDLSQLNKFTSTTGELLPVYYTLVYPNDKISLRSELKTRTMPLNSAAMVSLKEHIDWFAVPLDQLYKFFSQQYYGILDNHSSIFDTRSLVEDFPLVDSSLFTEFFYSSLDAPDEYFNGSNIEGKSLLGSHVRFLEFLDVPLNDYGSDHYNVFPYSINPFLLAAYNKIYMDYFRLTDREKNEPRSYNLDISYDSPDVSEDFLLHALKLRYRPKGQDFFTHLYVSPLFKGGPGSSDVGSSPSQSIVNQFQQWLVPAAYSVEGTPVVGAGNSYVQPVVSNYDDVRKALSPQAIRTSFAVSKLLEVTRRAGKHIDQQTLAHFGVKPSKYITGEVRHLGHHSQKLVIGDVVSTAETNEAALGQIGGKGYGYGKSSKITYKNEEACPVIIMAIYSAEVEMDYKVTGLGRFNTYTSMADFYNPVFDNLGMQPLFGYQSFLNPNPNALATWNNKILGWQYRWMESKVKHNRVLGNLARQLDYWTVYTPYMTSQLNSFLVSPFSLDSIMVTPYTFNAKGANTLAAIGLNPGTDIYEKSNAFETDPLFHELYIDAKLSSTMSTYGLEKL